MQPHYAPNAARHNIISVAQNNAAHPLRPLIRRPHPTALAMQPTPPSAAPRYPSPLLTPLLFLPHAPPHPPPPTVRSSPSQDLEAVGDWRVVLADSLLELYPCCCGCLVPAGQARPGRARAGLGWAGQRLDRAVQAALAAIYHNAGPCWAPRRLLARGLRHPPGS